jgi:cardiolipin synthase
LQSKSGQDENLSDDLQAEFKRLAELLETPAYQGNRIDLLVNGDCIFPSMLQAIDAAEREICFETFIYWSGEIAHRFGWGLIQAAKRGVKVHVLLDWWGALKMDEELIDQMRDGGVRVRYFNPLRWWQLKRLNYRTHRKIMVVDMEVAFTGGVGIADVWRGDAASPDQWHDLHYRITGPVVRCFHDAFLELWSEVLKEPRLAAADETPAAIEGRETVTAQVMTSSPRQGSERAYRAYRCAIETSQQSLRLMTAYFVPDQDTIAAMIAATERGVRFDVMVPGQYIDSTVVRYASRSSWGKLLNAGINIHVYDPTMLHAKVMIVDDKWLLVGSANFDNRSFSLNDEIIMTVFSPRFAAEHRELFERDSKRCHSLTHLEWKHRGIFRRCQEALANLVRPHL